jgi:hypothetical protein
MTEIMKLLWRAACMQFHSCSSGEVVAPNLPEASKSTATEVVGENEDFLTSSLHNPAVEPPKPLRFTHNIKDKVQFLSKECHL